MRAKWSWGLPVLMLTVLLPSCGKKEEPAGPKIPLPTANTPIDTTYISDDFLAAVVVHPARVLKSDAVKQVLKNLEEDIKKTDPKGKQTAESMFAEIKKKAGFDPRTLEQAIALVDADLMKDGAKNLPIPFLGGRPDGRGGRREPPGFREDLDEPPDQPLPSIILRFSEPVDQKALLSVLAYSSTDINGKTTAFPLKKQAGKPYYSRRGMSVAFVDDGKTVLIAKENLLKKMLKAKNVDSPLTKRLSTLGAEHDLIVAIAGPQIEQQMQGMKGILTLMLAQHKEYKNVPEYLGGLKSLAVTFSISSDPMMSVVLQLGDESAASGLVEVVNDSALPELKKLYEKGKVAEVKKGGDFTGKIVKLADEILEGLAVGNQGADVVISIKRPSAMAELPDTLFQGVIQAREAARRSTHKQNLHQIGLAFHNYHATYLQFPSHDSNGYPKGQGRKEGLSWRVHLLPFLDRADLYNQFKLDEPWDSRHNKRLIRQMPPYFANPSYTIEYGKTSTHVFVGPSTPRATTPFSKRKDGKGEFIGSIIRDFKDGTKNSLLVVEAGPDKAEIWTKPGGLPFDPKKNPFDALGNIGDDFLGLYCNGRVKWIPKTIGPKTLKLLIQHADGNIVPDF